MSTSQSFTGLSEPVGPDKISQGTFGYICARNRQRQYDIVIREFKKSGISQKELADRLGSTADIVSRLLARPSNWEADTFAKLLFAIAGAVAAYTADHPFRQRSVGVPSTSAGAIEQIEIYEIDQNQLHQTTGSNVVPFRRGRGGIGTSGGNITAAVFPRAKAV